MNNELSIAQSSGLGFVESAVQTFEGIQRLAELMAKMGTMPDHLKGKTADCFRIVVQSAKWKMDPFAVAECTSLVYGRLCYEGKLVAAVLQSMGAIDGVLDYEITGTGLDATIVVTGTPKGAKKPQILRGSVKEWRTTGNNSPWEKQPLTQLVYRGTRQWARLYAPGALLGVYTPDEFDGEPIDVTTTATVHPAEPEPARTSTTGTTSNESSKARESKPNQEADAKKGAAHPAIIAARELYRNLGTHGPGILNRLAKLYGAEKPQDIAAEKLELFGKDVAELAKHQKELAIIEDMLGGWEIAAREGQG